MTGPATHQSVRFYPNGKSKSLNKIVLKMTENKPVIFWQSRNHGCPSCHRVKDSMTMEAKPHYEMDFKNVKKQVLQGSDLSKKGSIDESIRDLVEYINELEDYVTTSSCSGRSILYTAGYGCILGHKKSKKDCKWLFSSHDFIDPDIFISHVNPMDGDLLFKFEPFILHVQCSDLEKAKSLHTIAIGAGFRDSGITVGKHGKIILAIRSNLRLELPLSQDNVMLVSDIYLKFLAEHANEKMDRNQRNIKHFFIILKETFGPPKTANEEKV